LLGFLTGAFLSFGKFWSNAQVVVPNVVGQSQEAAKNILTSKNLRVQVTENYDADVPEGFVISQTPAAGETVKEDRLVTIYVSKGGEKISVPDVTGLTKEEAANQLSKAGLKVGDISEEFSDKPAGTVLRQSPNAGDKLEKGKSVDLIVSKGQEVKKSGVPDVIGDSLGSAKEIIQKMGFSVGSVTEQESDRPSGTVLSQSPQPASEAAEKSAINLVVAKQRTVKNSTKEPEPNNGSAGKDLSVGKKSN
jgi:serine/threonine-protein kinase